MLRFQHSVGLIILLMVSTARGSELLVIIQDDEILPILQTLNPNLKLILDIVKLDDNITQNNYNAICSMYRPKLILDMTTWRSPSENAKKITRYSEVPTITTSFGGDGDFLEWLHLNERHSRIFIQIKQPGDLVPHVVGAIIKKQKCKNAGILYDNTFMMMHQRKSLLLNVNIRHSISAYNVSSLVGLIELEYNNIFVIGTRATIERVLVEACRRNYLSQNFAWYGITLHADGEISLNCPNATAARYVLASPDNKHQQFFDHNFNESSLYEFTATFYYDIIKIGLEAYKYLERSNLTQLCNNGSGEDANKKVIETIVKKMLAKNDENRFLYNQYHIDGLWNSYVHVEMHLFGIRYNETQEYHEHLGDWSSVQLTRLVNAGNNLENYKPVIFYNIVIAIQEPFIYPDPKSKRGYSGFCIDLIEEIALKVDFKYELYRPAGNGHRYDFEAALNDVIDGKADIALGSISATQERAAVDFTVPFYELVGMLIMMKIPESSKSIFKIIEVLDIGVWCIIVVFFCITSSLLWLYDKFSPYSSRRNKGERNEMREFTMRECLWFTLTSLTSQGGGEAPVPFSSKVVAALWWFFAFLIVASYTAILAAFLTASHLESSMESLDDLSKQYLVKYGVINGSNGHKYFKNLSGIEALIYKDYTMALLHGLTLEYYQEPYFYPINQMYSKMLMFMTDSRSMPFTWEEAKRKVRGGSMSSGSFAYIGDATDIKFAALTSCDLQAVGEEFHKHFYSLVIQKNSPLKQPLDAAIMDLLNERKLESMRNKWWRENPKVAQCSAYTDGITVQNIVGVFLLIGGGVLVALVIRWLENAHEKRKLRKT